MDKKYVIAIDFDGNLHNDWQPIQERIEIVKKLANNGHRIYLLTASLQPYLKTVIDNNQIYYYQMTDEYWELHNKIYYWCRENGIYLNIWDITPIKQHDTDFYVDISNRTWEEIAKEINHE